MNSFRAGVVAGMTAGGTLVCACLWNRPYYGLVSGMIHSAVTIGIRELFGKKASAVYIAGIVIYSVGVIRREVLKSKNKNTPETPQIKTQSGTNDVEKIADVYVSMAGNPAHMGHMHMIALAVNRLVEKGYQINQVKVVLSEEQYLKDKVQWSNKSIEKHNENPAEQTEMFRVLIPRIKRIEFLRAAIKQAKDDEVFDKSLDIDYVDDSNGLEWIHVVTPNSPEQNSRKTFYVCGADFASDKPGFVGMQGMIKHVVIVTRDGNLPNGISETDENDFSRLIVSNNDKNTSIYSSSKIQNGAYDQLPPSVREEFKKLLEEAQPIVFASASQATLFEEVKKFSCPIARVTGIAIAKGFYITSSGKKIFLRSGVQLLEGSRVVANAVLNFPTNPNLFLASTITTAASVTTTTTTTTMTTATQAPPANNQFQRYEKSEIVVIEQDCLYSAEMELKNGAKKVAVLMLASPLEPGGAMEEGNNGQEEELCRRADVFGFMWDQARGFAKSSMYNLVDLKEAHEKNPQYSSMTNNRMIHVPQVTVFRSGKDDNYKMLEAPFEVGMLVSPGLNRPGYEKINGKTRYLRAEDEEQLLKVLSTQLKVAYEEGYDTVILGAFGCGAFSNPPELIAEYYKKIIDTHFKGAFKKIIFAILDNGVPGKHNPEGNLKPFQQCFEFNQKGRIGHPWQFIRACSEWFFKLLRRE